MSFENERISLFSWRKSIRLRQSRQIKERVRNTSRHFCVRHASERIGSVLRSRFRILDPADRVSDAGVDIFSGIYINYKRRQRDEPADETVSTSAEADKQIGR